MDQLVIIEIEKQERLQTTSRPNYRDSSQLDYTASQKALLWVDGEKHPDKFEYRLYSGTEKSIADSAQPLPVGKYQLKSSAFGISYNNINCDFSELEPVKAATTRAAA